MKNLRIVFMGTPDFALCSLRTLVEAGVKVVGVVTMPDKPKGRHQNTPQPSPVKQYATEAGLPVLQPTNLKDPGFQEKLQALKADLFIVVAFRMLPESVWSMPRLGTFNLHASLLPQYRGAAPINWAVMNGETQTGVTTFFLRHAIDTGDIIYQRSVPISDEDDAGTVHDRLMETGAALVLETVGAIAAGNAPLTPQRENGPLRPAPKIFKDTCRIDWTRSGRELFNFIRGLSPYPAAWTTLHDRTKANEIKIYKAHFSPACTNAGATAQPEAVTDQPREGDFSIVLSDGYLVIDELQVAGKRRMPSAEFLRGLHQKEGLKVT